jgi:hypothetical protein
VKFHIGLSVLKSTEQPDEIEKKLGGIFSPNFSCLQKDVFFIHFLSNINYTISGTEAF